MSPSTARDGTPPASVEDWTAGRLSARLSALKKRNIGKLRGISVASVYDLDLPRGKNWRLRRGAYEFVKAPTFLSDYKEVLHLKIMFLHDHLKSLRGCFTIIMFRT